MKKFKKPDAKERTTAVSSSTPRARLRSIGASNQKPQENASSAKKPAETKSLPVKEPKTTVKEEEVETAENKPEGRSPTQLDILAEGVHHSWSMLHCALTEFLACKDDTITQSLPPSLLVRILLVTSKIFRTFSDVNTPLLELLRLVKLYSADWEEQSAALKKLHADNEGKQRQLNIAVRRIEMAAIEGERIAKERRVMNWERLFARLQNQKSHGRRWKFLIHSFKEQLEAGQLKLDADVSSSESESDQEDGGMSSTRGHGYHGSMNHFSSRDNSLSLGGLSDELVTDDDRELRDPLSDDEEEENAADDFFGDVSSSKLPATRKKQLQGLAEEPLTTGRRSLARSRGNSPRSFHESNLNTDSHVQMRKRYVVAVETSDASVWTHEKEYDHYLHLQLYPPENLKGVNKAACTVSLGDQIFDSQLFILSSATPPGKTDMDAQLAGAEPPSQLLKQDFLFRLRNDYMCPPDEVAPKSPAMTSNAQSLLEAISKSALTSSTCTMNEKPREISVVVHSNSPQGPIIAMTTVLLTDLLKDTEEVEMEAVDSDTSGNEPQSPSEETFKQHDVLVKSLAGGSDGIVPVAVAVTRVARPLTCAKATSTLPLDEIMAELATEHGYVSQVTVKEEEQRRAEEERNKELLKEDALAEALVEHATEMQQLQAEYESRLEALTQTLEELRSRQAAAVETETDFVEHGTQTSQRTTPRTRSPSSRKLGDTSVIRVETPKSGNRLVQSHTTLKDGPVRQEKLPTTRSLGKDRGLTRLSHPYPKPEELTGNLPQDFLERLAFLTKESLRRQQELAERVQKEVGRVCTKQIEAQNHLAKTHSHDDVCLPAMFMPTVSTRLVYTPRAHAYFHPTGSKETRITQPPTVLKLPSLPQSRNAMATINLFEIGKSHPLAGTSSWKDSTHPPSLSRSAVTDVYNSAHETD